MEIALPRSQFVNVERLAGCFNNVTNSYKYYWFLAILERVIKSQDLILPVNDLIAEMVSMVWFPANYFRLNFGKQDRLRYLVEHLQQTSELPANASPTQVKRLATAHLEATSATGKELGKLGAYVPYRFLRPFVGDRLRGISDQLVNAAVQSEADGLFQSNPQDVPYRMAGSEAIELSPLWRAYLFEHYEILKGFCLWHLVNYLQRNNPNVTNVAGKLSTPQQRVLHKARKFWQIVFHAKGSVACIYSGQRMTAEQFTLDHFLPWRFVAHDLLWNLTPTTKEVNSRKSDCLPNGDLYFEPFAQQQYEAVQMVARTLGSGKDRLLEDYALLLRVEGIDRLSELLYAEFRDQLLDVIVPQTQIARNMGFRTNWELSNDLMAYEFA